MSAQPASELLDWFERTGYVRRYDPQRRIDERHEYKKGSEVRFVLASKSETSTVRQLLRAVGLHSGRPFDKHGRIVLPVYGEEALRWFLDRLPVGRERTALGFSAGGRRAVRRPSRL